MQKYASKPKHRKGTNPYEGAMAEGYAAFHAGMPRSANRYPGGLNDRGKGHSWDQGWIKARLAKEQGKHAL